MSSTTAAPTTLPYAELDGAARGAGIDVGAALADMVAYNGGRPLTCRA